MKTISLFFEVHKTSIITFLLFFTTIFLNAKDIYVNDTNIIGDIYTTKAGNDTNTGLSIDSPKASLSAAYSIAIAGDTIYVDNGKYYVTSSISFNKISDIKIIGAGAGSTIFISGSTKGVVRFADIAQNNITFKGLQITKFDINADGAALSITNGTGIVFDQVIIYSNVSQKGQGAISISGSTTSVTIKNSTISCNSGTNPYYGGGIKNNGSTLIIDNSSINNNYISNELGGAIRIMGETSRVYITKTTFDNNSSQGGGAICQEGGTLAISNSCFNSNQIEDSSSSYGGGAIFIKPDAICNSIITECSFTNNKVINASGKDGGAIMIGNFSGSNTSNISFTTCSFTDNSTAKTAGDIYFDKSYYPTINVSFKNCSFNTIYQGTKVNIYNNDFDASWIKFEGLLNTTTNKIGGNGDFVEDGKGVAINNPEMKGVFTELTTLTATSAPTTTCMNRFIGACNTDNATFTCTTLNVWDGKTWSRGTSPTVNEHAYLASNYNTSTFGNISACVMTIASGVTLTIDNDDKDNVGVDSNGTFVKVINSINNNGTIDIKNNGNLIQINYPLDLNNETIVSPNILFTKTSDSKIGWDYINCSKPVTSDVMTQFNIAFDKKLIWNPDLCTLGEAKQSLGWITFDGEPSLGVGFNARIKTALGTVPTSVSITVNGVSTNGNYSSEIKFYDGADQIFRNYTLLGNPYPGAINFNDFYNDNKDKIYGTAYFITTYQSRNVNGLYRESDYVSYNLTGGCNGANTIIDANRPFPNEYVASVQGFLVRTKLNSKVEFKNTHRTTDAKSNSKIYRSSQSTSKNRFWLHLNDSYGKQFEILIGYIPEATNSFDDAYDGLLKSNATFKFYSKIDTSELVIQGKGNFVDTDVVPLGYVKSNNNSNSLSISIYNPEGIFNGSQVVYLHDKELNVYHDLRTGAYKFTNATNTTDRFEIVYRTDKLDVIDNENFDNKAIALLSKSKLNISATENINSVEMYDITGKLIFEQRLNETTSEFETNFNISNGIYILKVKLENDKIYSKKIITKD